MKLKLFCILCTSVLVLFTSQAKCSSWTTRYLVFTPTFFSSFERNGFGGTFGFVTSGGGSFETGWGIEYRGGPVPSWMLHSDFRAFKFLNSTREGLFWGLGVSAGATKLRGWQESAELRVETGYRILVGEERENEPLNATYFTTDWSFGVVLNAKGGIADIANPTFYGVVGAGISVIYDLF